MGYVDDVVVVVVVVVVDGADLGFDLSSISLALDYEPELTKINIHEKRTKLNSPREGVEYREREREIKIKRLKSTLRTAIHSSKR